MSEQHRGKHVNLTIVGGKPTLEMEDGSDSFPSHLIKPYSLLSKPYVDMLSADFSDEHGAL